MPKKRNKETGSIISFGLKKEQKRALEKEALELDISVAKLIRRKLYGQKKQET